MRIKKREDNILPYDETVLNLRVGYGVCQQTAFLHTAKKHSHIKSRQLMKAHKLTRYDETIFKNTQNYIDPVGADIIRPLFYTADIRLTPRDMPFRATMIGLRQVMSCLRQRYDKLLQIRERGKGAR